MPTMNNIFRDPFSYQCNDVLGLRDDGARVPRTDLLSYPKDYTITIDSTDYLLDVIGKSTRDIQLMQYGVFASGDYLTGDITSGTTVVSNSGDSTITLSENQLDYSATGLLYSFVLSNGSEYEYPTYLDATTAVYFDVSGNNRHLTLQNDTAVDADSHCCEALTVGSDWLNQMGWTPLAYSFYQIYAPSDSNGNMSCLASNILTSNYESLISSDLADWTYTDGVGTGASGLYLPGPTTESAHANAALSNTGLDTYRSFWVQTDGVDNNPRISFGTDLDNFIYFYFYGNDWWQVTDGELGTIMYNGSLGVTPEKVRLTLFGTNEKPVIQYFSGTELLGTVVAPDGTTWLPEGEIKYGLSWRNTAYSYNVEAFGYDQPTPDRYLHISIDDVLTELVESLSYDSIWDSDFFGALKSYHDTYGAVFSCYLFNVYLTHSVTDMTDKHKAELAAASDWLKFGFHSYENTTSYDATITTADSTTHYQTVMTAIETFAGTASIDHMPRINYYDATLDHVLAWKQLGLIGLLSAEDTRTSYYHSALQVEALQNCDSLVDYENEVHFVHTALRLENDSDPASTLADFYSSGTREFAIFTHETYLLDVLAELTACCEWASANGLAYNYPEKIRENTIDTLLYPGRAKYNFEIVSGNTMSDRVIKAPLAPELIAADADSTLFTTGVANSLDLATYTDTVRVRFGTKAGAVYSTDQDAATIVKIDKVIGNS